MALFGELNFLYWLLESLLTSFLNRRTKTVTSSLFLKNSL